MNLKLEYIPYSSVGPFEIDSPIDQYLKLYPYLLSENTDEVGWDTYTFFDETVDVWVDESGRIAAVACRQNLYFDGFNLINADINECLKILAIRKEQVKSEKLWVSDTEQQTVYDVEKPDIQLWTNDKGKIVTVIVG